MKVYLAARFRERARLEGYGNQLKAFGFTITSSWVYGGEEGLNRSQIATLDISDVDACDTLVLFTLPYGTPVKGGGRFVEFGYALARGKRLIVIGDRENVFIHHPGVEVYPTFESWLHHLNLVQLPSLENV